MDPFVRWCPAEDTNKQIEAERYVKTAKDILLSGKTESNIEKCRELVIKALGIDRCTPGGNALLVVALALRATNHRHRLPSGAIDPYAVFGLIPEVPTARKPAVIEAYYRQASGLLKCHPRDPGSAVFAEAAGLVADAWAFLSDPHRKASLDSRFEAPVVTAPLASATADASAAADAATASASAAAASANAAAASASAATSAAAAASAASAAAASARAAAASASAAASAAATAAAEAAAAAASASAAAAAAYTGWAGGKRRKKPVKRMNL